MKKTFTYLGISVLTIVSQIGFAQDQIENKSFENWEELQVNDSLDNWITIDAGYETNVNSIADGYSGAAIRLETIIIPDDGGISTGGIILAKDVGEEELTPFPYASHATDFHAHLRFDIEPTDGGIVLIYLHKDGIIISNNYFPIIGSQLSWDLFSWDLEYTALVPDSITIAVFSGGYFGEGTELEGSWVEIDSIYFTDSDGGTPAPIPNFDFEDWTNEVIDTPEDWFSFDPILATYFGFSNITQSTDAMEGTYSIKMETFDINEEIEVAPILTNGEFNFDLDDFGGGSAFTSSPMLYKGHYKYSSTATDTAKVFLRFWNAEGDLIENEQLLFSTAGEWDEFSIDVNLDFTPDSVLTVIIGGQQADAVLYLDDLRFVYTDAGVTDNTNLKLKAYPNPANSSVKIQLNTPATISITNIIGEKMFTLNYVDELVEVNTENWPNGVYLIQITNGNLFETKKIIVKH